ncbi:putative tricarboxylic transport membrane protein [Azospirillum agricola]|uniref:tripartite tricarboxylate transporter TctB family protein n=1 Tax=Azospirillum agricola TaxID=1720247 RepID=UPI001AE6AE0E|nr:tripartite tricarboxylate transporter TctB family protein [Azospirillum agricola]MBP2231926.1 putative tricarboxylic transport membrane protein [Azospirillum agricola]
MSVHTESAPETGRRATGPAVDLWAAGLFVATGTAWLGLAGGYAIGNAGRMGPGFFPALVAGLLLAVGAAIGGTALARGSERFEPFRLRPLAAVLGSVLVFGLAVDRLGLLLTAVLLVVIAGQSLPGGGLRQTLLLAAGLAAACWLLFIVLLGVPLEALPR